MAFDSERKAKNTWLVALLSKEYVMGIQYIELASCVFTTSLKKFVVLEVFMGEQ